MKTHEWLTQHEAIWNQAVIHPFLDHCRDGEIEPDAFHRWLVQDRLFVIELTRMAGRVLASAPETHMDVLLGGLTALKDELSWFREKAEERQLQLDVPMLPTCRVYCDLMHELAARPYPVQAAAFWAIERAYNEAWQRPGPMKAPYDEFADRWGNESFSDYVRQLAAQADVALAEASAALVKEAEQAFLKVAALEKDFWGMAWG